MAKGLQGHNGTTNAGARYVGKNPGTRGLKAVNTQKGKNALST